MENIFVEFLPPWIETGMQPAFYDKESGSVLQQTARMYARVNMLIRMFNKLSKQTKQTVEEYINQFNELYSYVHDYFDNLDVQEEVNNKLDQMYEDGQLTQLIAQFLSLNAVMSFSNVASMKLAENLVNGSTVETYGFYNKNDNGNAKYFVRTITNEDVVDEKTIIALHDNTLVAELIVEPIMNPEQFGAKGDGETDDTSSIQTAINKLSTSGSVLRLQEKTYMVKQILVANNTIINGNGPASIIKGHGDASSSQNRIIFGNNKSNWIIENIKIDVNSAERTAITASDIAISINGGSNVEINNVTIITGTSTDAYGIRIGKSSVRPSDVNIHDCKIYVSENGFNGIAITSGKNIIVKDNIIYNNYSNTGYAIDLEANTPSDPTDDTYRVNNVIIENNICNGSGIGCIGVENVYNKDISILNNIINYSNSNASLAIEAILIGGIQNVIASGNIINYNNGESETSSSKYNVVRLNGKNIKFSDNLINVERDTYSVIRTLNYADNVDVSNNTINGLSHNITRVFSMIDVPNYTFNNNNVYGISADYCFYSTLSTTSGTVVIENNKIINTKGRGFYITHRTNLLISNNYFAMYRNKVGNCTNVIIKDNVFNRLTSSYDVMEDSPATDNTYLIYSNNDVIGTIGSTVWNNAKNIFHATYYPSTGAWKRGDVVLNSAPVSGVPIGWICTVGGTPGTWVSMPSL